MVTGDGRQLPVDVLLFGTGFDVGDTRHRHHIVGRGGAVLGEGEGRREAVESMRAALMGTARHVPKFGYRTLFVPVAPNPAIDRGASVDAALARIKSVNRQPSFEWIYALDGLSQP